MGKEDSSETLVSAKLRVYRWPPRRHSYQSRRRLDNPYSYTKHTALYVFLWQMTKMNELMLKPWLSAPSILWAVKQLNVLHWNWTPFVQRILMGRKCAIELYHIKLYQRLLILHEMLILREGLLVRWSYKKRWWWQNINDVRTDSRGRADHSRTASHTGKTDRTESPYMSEFTVYITLRSVTCKCVCVECFALLRRAGKILAVSPGDRLPWERVCVVSFSPFRQLCW